MGGVFVTLALAIIFNPIYTKLKDKKFFKHIVLFFTQSASQKSKHVENSASKNNVWKKLFIVFVFVAIPVSGTGVYTGTILAIFMGLNYVQTILSVTLGNIVAGLVIMLVCSIFPEFTTIIFFVFLGFVAIYLVYRIVVMVVSKKTKQESSEE